MLVGWSGVSCAEAGTRSGVPSWLPILCPPDSSSASWLNQVPSNACWRPNVTQSSDAVWFGTPDLLSCCFPLSNHVAVVHTFVPDLTTGRCSERLATLVRRCLPCQSFSNCEQNLSIFASLTVRMSQQHLALPLDVTASLSETLKFTDQVLLTWWNLFPDFTPAILPFCHSLSGRACVRSFSGLSMFVAVLPSDEFCISHFYNLVRCLLFTFKTECFHFKCFQYSRPSHSFAHLSIQQRAGKVLSRFLSGAGLQPEVLVQSLQEWDLLWNVLWFRTSQLCQACANRSQIRVSQGEGPESWTSGWIFLSTVLGVFNYNLMYNMYIYMIYRYYINHIRTYI